MENAWLSVCPLRNEWVSLASAQLAHRFTRARSAWLRARMAMRESIEKMALMNALLSVLQVRKET